MQLGTNESPHATRQTFIDAMRVVANSVTVVTSDGSAGRHGATVSAFSSVSADPPTILVCLRSQSRIAHAVAENGVFCVNVLPRSSQDIAERFAGCHDARIENRFEGIRTESAYGSAPAIEGATAFSCVVEQVVTSGSHRIFIGLVCEVRRGVPEPLTYFDGKYHHIVLQNPVTHGFHAAKAV